MKIGVIKGVDVVEIDIEDLMEKNAVNPLHLHIIDEHMSKAEFMELLQFLSKAYSVVNKELYQKDKEDDGFLICPFGLGFKLISLYSGDADTAKIDEIIDKLVYQVIKPGINTYMENKYKKEIGSHIKGAMEHFFEENSFFDEELGAKIIQGTATLDDIEKIAEKLGNALIDYKNRAVIATNGTISDVEYNEDQSIKQFKLNGELFDGEKLDKFLKNHGKQE